MTRHFRIVLGLELRRSRAATIWLSVVAIAYAGIIAAMYPILEQNADLLKSYLELFPKELLAAFGMAGGLAAPGVFFATYIGLFLWPILSAIAAILVATRAFAADTDRGWSEIPLATPLTRVTLGLASIAGQAILLAVLAAATVGTVLLVGAIVGAAFDPGRFAIAGLVIYLFACALAAVTSLVAVASLSRAVAGGVTAGILLAMYLVNIVAQLQPDLAFLADISAFKYLTTTGIIDRGASPAGSVLVFGIVSVAGWAGAVLLFRRRDLLT